MVFYKLVNYNFLYAQFRPYQNLLNILRDITIKIRKVHLLNSQMASQVGEEKSFSQMNYTVKT